MLLEKKPCKRVEIELWLWAIKDSYGSCMLHFISMRLTNDEILLNHSVISPERQGKEQRAITL
jgi:hypothetical protein